MKPPVKLQQYEQDAVDAVLAATRAGKTRGVVALPDGANKAIIMSRIIDGFLRETEKPEATRG